MIKNAFAHVKLRLSKCNATSSVNNHVTFHASNVNEVRPGKAIMAIITVILVIFLQLLFFKYTSTTKNNNKEKTCSI